MIEEADARALAEIQARSYATARSAAASWPRTSAFGPEDLARFLGSHRYCVLATARPDGRAQAAPVGFLLAERTFWIASVAGARLRNLRATPWGSLVVMEGEGALHRLVTAEGPVRIHDGAAFDEALRLLEPRWREKHGRSPGWASALLELRPERLFSYTGRG